MMLGITMSTQTDDGSPMTEQHIDKFAGVAACFLQIIATMLLIARFFNNPVLRSPIYTGTLICLPAIIAAMAFLLYESSPDLWQWIALLGGSLAFLVALMGMFTVGGYYMPFAAVMLLSSARLARRPVVRWLALVVAVFPLLISISLAAHAYDPILVLPVVFGLLLAIRLIGVRMTGKAHSFILLRLGTIALFLLQLKFIFLGVYVPGP